MATPSGTAMVDDADVVVDPDGKRLDRRRVEGRQLAHVGEESRRAEAVAPLRHGAVLRRESLPCHPRVVGISYELVAMPDRRLDLQRRQNADLAQVLRRGGQPLGRRSVLLHLREADPRGEPHFVHAGAVFRELRKSRLPHLRPVGLGLPQPNRRKRNRLRHQRTDETQHRHTRNLFHHLNCSPFFMRCPGEITSAAKCRRWSAFPDRDFTGCR